jgi:hypothetical protein
LRTTAPKTPGTRRTLLPVALAGLLVAAAAVLGIALHPLALDDAFITYRYAYNLATGQGFVYNAGQAVLSTTAPLWALILAAGAILWPGPATAAGQSIPALANALSAAALGIGAVLTYLLGRREGTPWTGALAALFFVLYPLLWLSLGLETAFFLALALGALLAYRRGHLYWTAVLLALATLARGDGLILAAVLAADYALHFGRAKLRRRAGLRDQGPGQVQAVAGDEPTPSPQPSFDRAQDDYGGGAQDDYGDSARRREDGGRSVLQQPRLGEALGAAAVYVAVMVPVMAWLAWRFGSPVPATLAAKRAQAGLGVTGFYAHTTYLQGLGILARARLAQSPLYGLFLPAAAVGLVAMWSRAGWVRLMVLWGGAHLLGYTLLGVTPYAWYYAPLVPGLVSVSALGIVESGRWLATRGRAMADQPLAGHRPTPGEAPMLGLGEMGRVAVQGAAWIWAGALLLALVQSDRAMVAGLQGTVPPPEDPVSKVLPEAKVGVYEQAGRWLGEHTPADAVVGVTEMGVIGYYSRRPMIDFLGLLEPDVADAVARGDLYWALLRYQPDYVALTAVSPLYAYDLRADPWFQAAYTPRQTFEDPRFWGSPLTVYQRQVPRQSLAGTDAGSLPAGTMRIDADLGGQIRLLGVVTGDDAAQPGDVLALTLYWQALAPMDRDYTAFVHLLGQYDRVIAQRDAAPGLGARPTGGWTPGQVVADPYLLAVPEAAYAPDEAVWEVGLYEAGTGDRLATASGGDNVRFGSVAVEPAAGPLHLDFGPAVLTGYELDRLALTPVEPLAVTLHWTGPGPAEVTVRLVSLTGEVASRVVAGLDQERYVLLTPPDVPAGAYKLEVLVADPATGRSLPLLGADGQPRSDQARLTTIRVYR